MSISTLTADRIGCPLGQLSTKIYTSHTLLPFRHIPLRSIRPLPPTPVSPTITDLDDSFKPLPTLPPINLSEPLTTTAAFTTTMPSISVIPATPLPSTPSSPIPPSPTTCASSSIPATPTDYTTPRIQLGALPTSPRSRNSRNAPLRVCTSPDVLYHPTTTTSASDPPRSGSLTPTKSPASINGSLLSPTSPLLPDLPRAPSPTTARRRRLSKLRRHLGEGVPPELVYSPPRSRSRSVSLSLGLPGLERKDSGGALVFQKQDKLKNADKKVYDTDFGSISANGGRDRDRERRGASKLVESDDTDDEEFEFDLDDEEEAEDDGVSMESGVLGSEEYHWVLSRASRIQISSPTPTPTSGANSRRSGQRFSKRWYREQGGQRWEENDYNILLKQLRSL